MANPNYILLETITVGEAGASSVTFNNIPQSGYTDLKIVASVLTSPFSTYTGQIFMQLNNSSTNYSSKMLEASTASPSSSTNSHGNTNALYCGEVPTTYIASNVFSNTEIYIPNYLSTNAKSVSVDGSSEGNNNTDYQHSLDFVAGLWNVTGSGSVINQIKFLANSDFAGTFQQYSTFSLYGLAAVGTTPVIAPYASGGDIIQTDGTYWYHAFLSSGTFTPAKALSCDYLVVAGGGGGNGGPSGGGGAGGVLGFASQALTANTGNTVIVGAGGAGAAGSAGTQYLGSSGGNSQFASLTASVGGGATATNGGSGGGADVNFTTAGTGTSGQGNNGGGQYTNGAMFASGGGGGKNSNGGTGVSGQAGAGGTGVNSVTNFGSLSTALSTLGLNFTYIAGGGGGGASWNNGNSAAAGAGGSSVGGNGGAGTSSYTGNSGSAGVPNTGSGGGGGGYYYTSGNNQNGAGGKGGSGIVIVRYAI